MRLFSYVVVRDFGFAPNPFYGICTLATCKPDIRRTAVVGDWVVGTGTAKHNRQGYLVYAMRVDEAMTYDEYWVDPRFQRKKPNLGGSFKQAYGDNIYSFNNKQKKWMQADSHHSLERGIPNEKNISADTKANRVLIGYTFIYFGGAGPKIPKKFRDWNGFDVCKKGPGHKCYFPDRLIEGFTEWVRSFNDDGYVHDPFDWKIA